MPVLWVRRAPWQNDVPMDRQPLFRRNPLYLPVLTLVGTLLASGCAMFGTTAGTPDQERWRPAATRGDAEAQYRLAETYCCGIGLRRSTKTALYWHCRAAMQDHMWAQYQMGRILSNFFDDPDRGAVFATPDYVSAYMWFTVAALTGHPGSLVIREKLAGSMSPEDVMQAKRWATKWKQTRCDNLR